MDCQTARMLLPYAARPAELGPEDTADLSAHLAACADCGALARSEKSFDDAIGRAMIAVPVPDGLLGNINNRLRRSLRRKHLLRMGTAAAAVFLVTVTAAVWGTHKIEVHPEALATEFEVLISTERDSGQVEEYFRQRGLKVKIPAVFDLTALAYFDVGRFKGHDVAFLYFVRGESRAQMYVLPKSQFRLAKGELETATSSRCSIEVIDDSSSGYLIVVVYEGEAKKQHFQNTAIVG